VVFPPDPVFSTSRDPGPAFSTYPGRDSAREKRTKAYKKVTADTTIPRNWKALSLDNNSHKDLFSPLTSRVANFKFPEIKEVNFASDESVVESRGSTFIQKCVP